MSVVMGFLDLLCLLFFLFSEGLQVIVQVVVVTVKRLLDNLTSGALADDCICRFLPGFVVVEKSMDDRMAFEKGQGFREVYD